MHEDVPIAMLSTVRETAIPPDVVCAAKSQRILVVDDNVRVEESLWLMLAIMRHETSAAHDGLEALDVAEAFRPAIIFLDIGMPKSNGYEVGRRIRQQDWGKNITMVPVTGLGRDEDKVQSLEAGLDYHLVKPSQPVVLEKPLRFGHYWPA